MQVSPIPTRVWLVPFVLFALSAPLWLSLLGALGA